MKKVIRLTESDLMNIVKRVINEQTTSDLYSAILGYMWKFDKEIKNSNHGKMSSFDIRAAFKEVMIFCEDMRDNKPAKKLISPKSKALFNTIRELVKDYSDITGLIQQGKNVKASRFA